MTKRFPYAGYGRMDCPDCGEQIEHNEPVAIVGDLGHRHLCCDACAEVHDDEEPEI